METTTTNERPSDSVLRRIKKLLATAGDSRANEHERDNAMRMAHATLAKYNLDMADLPEDRAETRGQLRQYFYGRPWARQVANSAAELMFCKYIYVPNSDAKRVGHIFIGKESNAKSAAILAEFLVGAIYKQGKAEARLYDEGNPYFRSFCLGAASRITHRVAEIIAAALRPGEKTPGTALVLRSLYDTERRENELVVAEMKLKPGRTGKPTADWAARIAGEAYGSTLSLNQQISKDPK